MTPLGHASIGLLVGVGMTRVFPHVDPSIVLTATVVGGTVLDLDLIYRYYQTGGNILDEKIGKHRYLPTHTPVFVVLAGTVVSMFNNTWGIFLTLGGFLHLLLDTLFFPEGVNFIYPFGKRMTRFFYIKTHPFWAPKEISGVPDWSKNYLVSPLFWIFEVVPTIIAIALYFLI